MRASILHLVGLVGYANGNTATIYNVTANTIVQQQPYESSNVAAESADIDSQQLDIFIDTQSQPVPQAVEEAPQVYKQGYQQIIEISSSTSEFTNSELIIYQQILLDGYANALLDVDNAETAEEIANEEEVSIKIIEQELTTLYGANSTSKNLLILSFILNNGQSTTLYEEYMNKNLTNMTLQLQTANLPIIQVFDIKFNSELDYNLDSIINTNSPTDQPTREPTVTPTESQSTMIPSKSPVTSSPTDSLSTPFPTVSDNSDNLPVSLEKLSYVVDSKMILFSTSKMAGDETVDVGEVVFSDTQKERWEEVTRDYILKSIQSTIGSAAEGSQEGTEEGGLDVTVSLNSYRVLSTSQSENEEQTSNLRRRLQDVSNEDTLPLELDFTTNIQLSKQILPEEDGKVLDGNELVASTFRSVESQNEYITLLKDSTPEEGEEEEDTNDIMNNVQSITLEVNNKLVTESNKEEEDKTVVFEEVEAETQSTTNEEMNERDMLMYIIIAVLGATFLCSITVCCCCGSKKKEKNEESSNKSKSLAESDSMAAAGGYDIEQHQQGDTSSEDGSTKYDTAGSQSSEGSSNSSQAAVYHSISIKAPRGKLGLVLVNNVTNDLAGITRIKDDSILSNQVNVGDLLLSVDEIDCRGMMACDVSELIGSRCENDERVLVLLREA